ncbi:MAG TPA: hypothetical protein VMH22_09285 [bacterium]|nr:hypothetical protein [bacterium]
MKPILPNLRLSFRSTSGANLRNLWMSAFSVTGHHLRHLRNLRLILSGRFHSGLLVCIAVLLFAACARVYVQPAIDLHPREVIGLIQFATSTKGELAGLVTQKFIEAVTEDQTDIKIVELGDEATVLAAVSQSRLGPEAFKAIGDKYNLKTVFTGELDVSGVNPSCAFGPGYASVAAKVNARLTAKLVETATGATLWSNSARDERTVAGVDKSGDDFSFNAQDKEEAYGDLARSLCEGITYDFRGTRQHRCCGKH